MMPLGIRLNYPVDECRDEIVRWQDLLLLTVFLDGQQPCISGTVSLEHLEKVAEETGDSVDWLVGRLRLYAPLFVSPYLPSERTVG